MPVNKARQLMIEKIAENVRVECNVTDYGFHNIFEAAEKIGYRVIRYPIGSESFLGFTWLRDSERIIFSNSSMILAREIFSVAHEIGHQKLHLAEQGITMIRDDDFSDRDEKEIEANYFAACLLMPEDKVHKFIRLELNGKKVDDWTGLDIARIQTVFHVSYDMAVIRLRALHIIPVSVSEDLKLEKLAKTTVKLLKAIKGNADLCQPAEAKKIPAEYLEWVISNYQEKLIPKQSLETALSYVDLHAEDVETGQEETEEDKSFDDLLKGMTE